MCRTLKNFYFRLRDFFFTAKYHANERKKLGAIKKAKKYLLDNTQEQKTINKIGFYLYGKNHLAHLQPIFRHLPKDDFEIVVSGDHPIPEYLLNVDYKVKTDLKVLSTGGGQMMKIRPWLEVPGDDFYIMKYDKIITMSEVKDKMIISMYTTYCDEGDFDFGTFVDESMKKDKRNHEVTKKMGYISTVEDARKKLEDLFKDT